MTARDEIADRLWWAVPSSDDAEAQRGARQMLDAYRAEVLRDAARVADRAAVLLYDDLGQHATEGVRRVADELRDMAGTEES